MFRADVEKVLHFENVACACGQRVNVTITFGILYSSVCVWGGGGGACVCECGKCVCICPSMSAHICECVRVLYGSVCVLTHLLIYD